MRICICALALLAFLAKERVLFGQKTDGSKDLRVSKKNPGLTYHGDARVRSLPATLDPAIFSDDRGAFVAYALAGKIRAVLYQMPCYCYCNTRQGHESLLDCYTSQHGRYCDVCRKEAVFGFLETKKGKSPAQIRKAIARGKAWRIDLDQLTDAWFPLLNQKVPGTTPNLATEFGPKGPNVATSKGEPLCLTQNRR